MLSQDSLIINADGSVYHLGLKPEQIAEKVIFVGDPERVPKVSAYFDSIEHIVQRREFITHTGYIGNTRISVLSTGIGTDNIDIVLNELNILWNIDFNTRTHKTHHCAGLILRLGTTGTVHEEVNIGDIIVSRYAIGMDNLGHYYLRPSDTAIQQYFENWLTQKALKTPFIPYFTQANTHFSDYIHKNIPCKAGITITNPGFYAPQNRLLYAKEYPLTSFVSQIMEFTYQENAVLNMEMETAGIFVLSNHLSHIAASLSVVLAHRKKGIFSSNPEKDIQQLIQAGMSILTKYPLKDIQR